MRTVRATWRKATTAVLVGGALVAGLPIVESASAAGTPTFDRILVGPSNAEMYPSGLEYDANLDRLVIADTAGDQVEIYTKTGTRIRTFGEHGTADGQFASPRDTAVDEASNIYVADAENDRVQKFDANGVWQWTKGGQGSCATCLNGPIGVTWDPVNDVLLVASTGQDQIKAFFADGTPAWQSPAPPTGTGVEHYIDGPRDATRGPDGRIWVTDYNHHKVEAYDVTPSGNWGSTTPVPVITLGQDTTGNALGQLNYPYNVVFSADGHTVYVSDTGNGRLARWSVNGTTTATLPPFGGRCANHPQPCEDPPADAGTFNHLRRVAVDADGNLYGADFWGNGIEVFTPAGASLRQIEGFNAPLPGVSEAYGVAIAPNGHVYVMDRNNHRIEHFDATGAYTGQAAGARGTQPGTFSWPEAVAVAPDGTVWAADTRGGRIERWPANLAFVPAVPSYGGQGTTVGKFNYIEDLDVASNGDVWIADTKNHRLQKYVPSTGVFTAYGARGAGNGQFEEPRGVAVGTNAVYVADTLNNRVQKLSLTGAYLGQFTGLTAPEGVAVAPDGTVWVANTGANQIVHLSADLANLNETFGSAGTGNGQFNLPHTLAATATELFVADTYNDRVQVFDLGATPPVDGTAPAVTISAPTPGATVGDPTTISGTATDNVGVTVVELAIQRGSDNQWLQANGTWGATEAYSATTLGTPGGTTTTWSRSFDAPANGSYSVKARARDAAANQSATSAAVAFTVAGTPPPDTTAPTGTLTSPTAGATVPHTTALTGTASDNVGVTRVEVAVKRASPAQWLRPDGTWGTTFVYAGNAVLGSPGGATTTWSFPITFPADGTFSLQARGYDAAGNVSASPLLVPFTTFQVGAAPDTVRPTGTVTAPAEAAAVPDPTTITGTATDNVGVTKVELAIQQGASGPFLKAGGTWSAGITWVPATLGSPGATSTTWSLDVNVPANGTYYFQVRGFDAVGSGPIVSTPRRSFVVGTTPDTTRPTGTMTTPAATGGTLPDPGTVTGTATDNVGVAAVQVQIRRGTTTYLQTNGTFTTTQTWLPAALASPGAATTTWSFAFNAPALGAYAIKARARDTSTTGNLTEFVTPFRSFTVVAPTVPFNPQYQGQIANPGGVAPLYPAGGVTAPDGTRYVADSGGSRVVTISPAGIVTPLPNNGYNDPRDIVRDPDGTYWVLDTSNSRIVHVDAAGNQLGTHIGGSTTFTTPYGIAVDEGALYVANTYRAGAAGQTGAVQRVDKAGNVVWTITTANGVAFSRPRDVSLGSDGNLYVADTDKHRIVVLNAATGAFVRAFGSQGGNDNQFRSPRAVTSDGAAGIWVADAFNYRIVHLSNTGTFLGKSSGTQTTGYGTGNDQYRSPHCVFMDGAFVDVCDTFGFRIQRYSVSGGAPVWSSILVGTPPANGGFNGPFAAAYGPAGELFVVDWFNHRIQKFDANGQFVLAFGYYGTGATKGNLIFPRGITVSGNEVVVTDSENNRIARFDLNGTFLGQVTPTSGAALNRPHQTAKAADGSYWIADTNGKRVVHLSATGVVLHSWTDGTTTFSPQGIAVDADGNVYVSNTNKNKVDKYSPTGTLLATVAAAGTADGKVNKPAGLLITGTGANARLWVADSGTNNRIQVLKLDGTFVAKFGAAGSGNGQFSTPRAVAVSPVDGDIAVADFANNRISLWSQS